MSEYMWVIGRRKPPRKIARAMDRICREEGGYGFVEFNVREGSKPDTNNGQYLSWLEGPNRGAPFDGDLQRRVTDRIKRELHWPPEPEHIRCPYCGGQWDRQDPTDG